MPLDYAIFGLNFPPILFTIGYRCKEQFRYIGWVRPFSLFFWAKKILRWSRSHKNECENWILWSVVTNQLLSLSKNVDNQKLLRYQSNTKMEKLFNTKNRDFSGKMGTQIVTYNIHQKSYYSIFQWKLHAHAMQSRNKLSK